MRPATVSAADREWDRAEAEVAVEIGKAFEGKSPSTAPKSSRPSRPARDHVTPSTEYRVDFASARYVCTSR